MGPKHFELQYFGRHSTRSVPVSDELAGFVVEWLEAGDVAVKPLDEAGLKNPTEVSDWAVARLVIKTPDKTRTEHVAGWSIADEMQSAMEAFLRAVRARASSGPFELLSEAEVSCNILLRVDEVDYYASKLCTAANDLVLAVHNGNEHQLINAVSHILTNFSRYGLVKWHDSEGDE